MVLSDQRTPYSIMYVWAAFEAKSPPTRQDVFTLIDNYTLYTHWAENCNICISHGFESQIRNLQRYPLTVC